MNTSNVSGSIALLILEVYHRVQTNAYSTALTYRQLFSYTTWRNLAGPRIPAPHTTRFVVRSDELLHSKYGRSATGAERPILIRSKYIYIYKCVFLALRHFLLFRPIVFSRVLGSVARGSPSGPRTQVWALAEVRGTCSGGSKCQVRSGRDSEHVEPSRCMQTHVHNTLTS